MIQILEWNALITILDLEHIQRELLQFICERRGEMALPEKHIKILLEAQDWIAILHFKNRMNIVLFEEIVTPNKYAYRLGIKGSKKEPWET